MTHNATLATGPAPDVADALQHVLAKFEAARVEAIFQIRKP